MLLRRIAGVSFGVKIGLFESIHATPEAEPCAPESPTMHLRESIH